MLPITPASADFSYQQATPLHVSSVSPVVGPNDGTQYKFSAYKPRALAKESPVTFGSYSCKIRPEDLEAFSGGLANQPFSQVKLRAHVKIFLDMARWVDGLSNEAPSLRDPSIPSHEEILLEGDGPMPLSNYNTFTPAERTAYVGGLVRLASSTTFMKSLKQPLEAHEHLIMELAYPARLSKHHGLLDSEGLLGDRVSGMARLEADAREKRLAAEVAVVSHAHVMGTGAARQSLVVEMMDSCCNPLLQNLASSKNAMTMTERTDGLPRYLAIHQNHSWQDVGQYYRLCHLVSEMTHDVSPLGYQAMSLEFKERLTALHFLAEMVGITDKSWEVSTAFTACESTIFGALGALGARHLAEEDEAGKLRATKAFDVVVSMPDLTARKSVLAYGTSNDANPVVPLVLNADQRAIMLSYRQGGIQQDAPAGALGQNRVTGAVPFQWKGPLVLKNKKQDELFNADASFTELATLLSDSVVSGGRADDWMLSFPHLAPCDNDKVTLYYSQQWTYLRKHRRALAIELSLGLTDDETSVEDVFEQRKLPSPSFSLPLIAEPLSYHVYKSPLAALHLGTQFEALEERRLANPTDLDETLQAYMPGKTTESHFSDGYVDFLEALCLLKDGPLSLKEGRLDCLARKHRFEKNLRHRTWQFRQQSVDSASLDVAHANPSNVLATLVLCGTQERALAEKLVVKLPLPSQAVAALRAEIHDYMWPSESMLQLASDQLRTGLESTEFYEKMKVSK